MCTYPWTLVCCTLEAVGLLADRVIDELAASAGSAQARAFTDLEDVLQRLLEAGRATWPTVDLEANEFVRHLARHLAEEPNIQAALHATRGPDLYLACACALGNANAVTLFERDFIRHVRPAVARMGLSKAPLDDVKQLVRQKLLVGEGGPPKISTYAGRGPLDTWVRVVAVRSALTFLRSPDNGAPNHLAVDDALLGLPSPVTSPETELMKARYAGEFKQALQVALASMSREDRMLLRLHFVNGLTIDQIGTIHRVHRSTAARWITRASTGLLDVARNALRRQLRLTPSEFDGLMVAVRSQLHLSLSPLLGGDGDE